MTLYNPIYSNISLLLWAQLSAIGLFFHLTHSHGPPRQDIRGIHNIIPENTFQRTVVRGKKKIFLCTMTVHSSRISRELEPLNSFLSMCFPDWGKYIFLSPHSLSLFPMPSAFSHSICVRKEKRKEGEESFIDGGRKLNYFPLSVSPYNGYLSCQDDLNLYYGLCAYCTFSLVYKEIVKCINQSAH